MRMRQFVVLTLVAVSALVPARAQQPALPYDLIMGGEEARTLLEALRSGSAHVPGELLVKFRSGVGQAAQARAVSILRRVDSAASRWVGDVMLLRVAGEPDAGAAASLLARQPEVEWAQPNYLRRLHAVPNDPSYSRQWNLQQIEAPAAWDINPGASSAVTVAVIDTGVTTVNDTFSLPLWTGSRFETVSIPFRTSPDLSAQRILPGRDFVFWAGPVLDMHYHGTHVASTVLQETNNGVALAGVAYAARLLPLKACFGYWDIQILLSAAGMPGFLDPRISGICPDSAITAAIRFAADSGAQVINLSVGGEAPSPAKQQAIQYAVQRGSFVAISVGNEFEFGNPIEYPAAYAADINGAVSIGAVGSSRRRATYSNTGTHLELMAPGGDFADGGIGGLVFQVMPFFPDFQPFAPRPRFDRYGEGALQGTSMAAPHVAGVAALLYTQGITSPAAIEAALKASATDLGPAGRDNEYGHGLINARAALRGMGLAK